MKTKRADRRRRLLVGLGYLLVATPGIAAFVYLAAADPGVGLLGVAETVAERGFAAGTGGLLAW
jgi:hypothetical protein